MTNKSNAAASLLGLLVIGLFSISANAQMGGATMAEVFIPDVDEESVIFQVPSKWYPYYRTTDNKLDTFIFPTGQEPTDWKDALEVEEYNSTLGVTAARQVFDFRAQGASCTEHSATVTKEAAENGYSMIQWSEECVNAEGDESLTLGKAILGNEKLYIITRFWKYDPWNSHIEEWQAYLDGVYVCDPTVASRAHPCRPPNAGGPGGERPAR